LQNNSRRFNLTLDREELKRLLKEKGVKSLDDFNAFMREETHRELDADSGLKRPVIPIYSGH